MLTAIFLLKISTGVYAETDTTLFEKIKESVRLSGSITAELSYYNVSQIDNRRDPFMIRVYGSPRISTGHWNIPVHFILGNDQRKYRQQFNKIGASPSYKWATFHLGHANLSFSPLVFSGHTILGAGTELTPGNIRFGLLYGRLLRPIEADTTLTEIFLPAFARRGMTMKIGYGTHDNFVDLVFLKAKDHVESAGFDPEEENVLPAENAAIGIVTGQRLMKHFFLNANLGLSAYTMDVDANESTPDSFRINRIPALFLTERASTQYLTALESSLEYRQRNYSIRLAYDRIEPEYKTMGIYFIRNDVERVRLASRIRLPRLQLNLSPQLGFERNNLRQTRRMTQTRFIGGIRADYRPNQQWSIHAGLHNFQVRLHQDISATEDTIVLNRVNASLNGGFTYRKGTGRKAQLLIFQANYLSGRDRAGDTIQQLVSNLNTRVAWRFHLEAPDLFVMPAVGFNYFQLPFVTTTRMHPSVQLNKELLNRKLTAGWSSGVLISFTDGVVANLVLRNTLSGSYRLTEKQSVQLRLAHLLNTAAQNQIRFSEMLFDLRYAYHF